ncbi:MAG: hypothetical protein ABIR18_16170 [Chitinophagaceae bacterium]
MIVKKLVFFCSFLLAGILSCKKDNELEDNINGKAGDRKITYVVDGTHFRLNYIDSNNVFQRDRTFTDHFSYEFSKGSGASIGMSIFLLDPSDQIYSWKIYIDDKLYANAFSEGGAYLTVPYH